MSMVIAEGMRIAQERLQYKGEGGRTGEEEVEKRNRFLEKLDCSWTQQM